MENKKQKRSIINRFNIIAYLFFAGFLCWCPHIEYVRFAAVVLSAEISIIFAMMKGD